MALDQTELAQIVSAVIQALKVGDTSAKPASISAPVDRLAQKDRALIAGFKRKGIKEADIKLMNRADPKAEMNVRPFQGWLQQGRQVRKGEKSIKGLFHISQTDLIAQPKPAPKSKAKRPTVKSQPPLV
jgi:hypothetical protein